MKKIFITGFFLSIIYVVACKKANPAVVEPTPQQLLGRWDAIAKIAITNSGGTPDTIDVYTAGGYAGSYIEFLDNGTYNSFFNNQTTSLPYNMISDTSYQLRYDNFTDKFEIRELSDTSLVTFHRFDADYITTYKK